MSRITDLGCMQFMNHFTIQRRDFDCTVDSEPYHVLHLMVNLCSGLFFIRVLGRTFARGSVKSGGGIK